MEGIALDAGFSKATVYACFADREDLFERTAERLAQDIVSAAESNLAADGDVTARVTGTLQSKDSMSFELVRASTHAAELFAASHALVRELFDETDERILKSIRRALNALPDEPLSAARLSRIPVRGSRGLAGGAESVGALRVDIAGKRRVTQGEY